MRLDDVIKEKEDAIFGKGSSEAEIEQAEKKLHLKFANDYREYLRKYSLVMYDGHELTGISSEKRVNVVNVTLDHQNERDSDDKYVIEDTGIEGIIIWQNSKGQIFENGKLIYGSLAEYIAE